MYQALVVILAGVVVYAFLKARRDRSGPVPASGSRPLGQPASTGE